MPITIARDLIRDAVSTFVDEKEIAEIKAEECRQTTR